ncbi:hypothetical protein EYF80_045893 [Liparis tanakae]|uniref:Uncharacterized protein n=1 Tax=Liparis tanakae TaxID=230148 RepID=A0A4Z2FSF0_9TELE|nr:hypothetical protein EYF80_045893 [Liparis tanakae]
MGTRRGHHGDTMGTRRGQDGDTTGTRRRHHGDTTGTRRRHHGDTTGTRRGHHGDTTGTRRGHVTLRVKLTLNYSQRGAAGSCWSSYLLWNLEQKKESRQTPVWIRSLLWTRSGSGL